MLMVGAAPAAADSTLGGDEQTLDRVVSTPRTQSDPPIVSEPGLPIVAVGTPPVGAPQPLSGRGLPIVPVGTPPRDGPKPVSPPPCAEASVTSRGNRYRVVSLDAHRGAVGLRLRRPLRGGRGTLTIPRSCVDGTGCASGPTCELPLDSRPVFTAVRTAELAGIASRVGLADRDDPSLVYVGVRRCVKSPSRLALARCLRSASR
jgi:hypothetical protein